MDWETFQAAYQQADQATKALIDSTKIADCIEVNFLEVEGVLKTSMIKIFSAHILGILSLENLEIELKKISVANDEKIIQTITCINGSNDQPEKMIGGIHTMADDMKVAQKQAAATGEEPTYTSTQTAILREGAQTKEDISARWGE